MKNVEGNWTARRDGRCACGHTGDGELRMPPTESTHDTAFAVSLEEMLAARERRVRKQEELSRNFNFPLVSFTLNIPGPVKVFDGVRDVFERGCQAIEGSLDREGIVLLSRESVIEKTGCEFLCCANASPERIKQIMVNLEEKDGWGRLYDIDVLRVDGTKVSREELGLPSRTCLLCGEPAHACARSRRHSVEELVTRIREMIARGYR